MNPGQFVPGYFEAADMPIGGRMYVACKATLNPKEWVAPRDYLKVEKLGITGGSTQIRHRR